MMKKDAEVLPGEVTDFLQEHKNVDIIVGLPCCQNVLTGGYVLSQVAKGLEDYCPNLSALIFVSDGGCSSESSVSSFKTVNFPSGSNMIPSLYWSAGGKGKAVRAILETVKFLDAKSVALISSDLRCLTPEWISFLITPTLSGVDFVAPYYNNRKNEGNITNFICYPVTRSLFGKDVRQPIGGDFGLSKRFVDTILESDLWSIPEVDFCGVDIFETYTALANNFNLKQACLGVKNIEGKIQFSNTEILFKQIMATMFSCIEKYEYVWKQIEHVSATELFGEELFDFVPNEAEISFIDMLSEYRNGFNSFQKFYQGLLSKEILDKFVELKDLETVDVVFPAEIWAKTVYSFIGQYHKAVFSEEKSNLIDALRILWLGRVACFVKNTLDNKTTEVESKIREEAKVFESLKNYLVEIY